MPTYRFMYPLNTKQVIWASLNNSARQRAVAGVLQTYVYRLLAYIFVLVSKDFFDRECRTVRGVSMARRM